MDIDYKIMSLREALKEDRVKPDNCYNFINAMLDMFKDVNEELNEINELVKFSKYCNMH